jgi:hypothetical protein
MPREPWQRAHGHGGLGPRHHRSTSGLRRGLFRPHEGEEDGGESHRDDRVRGGRLGLTAGSQFPSDMESRVHGGYPSRRYYLPAAGDSCVPGGYPASTRYLTVGDSSRPSMASRARLFFLYINITSALKFGEKRIYLPTIQPSTYLYMYIYVQGES